MAPPSIKPGKRLGKYRVRRRVGQGGFATVYRGHDTIEGIDVALKVPNAQVDNGAVLEELRKEVRLTARMEHPNILPMKNAEVIDGVFVIAYPLGMETLADRLRRRMSDQVALALCEQAIEAVAYAHSRRIIHCDIKPENFILFPEGRLRLGDFGIAKVAMRRMTLASGQGTVGYVAPEQALGRPSQRSDVFSLGLLIYRVFSGVLPVWPYDWPPAGIERAQRRLSPQMLSLLQRCMQVDDRARFAHAGALLSAFQRIRKRALASGAKRRARAPRADPPPTRWRMLRTREFMRRYGRDLEMRGQCGKCSGPVAESMRYCPWCRSAISPYRGPHRFSNQCRRCGRSAKADWRYCAYCYGAALWEPGSRRYRDKRYTARCRACREGLAPFMRYCPHCRRRTQQNWKLPEGGTPCKACRWGIAAEFWEACPWCGKHIVPTGARS